MPTFKSALFYVLIFGIGFSFNAYANTEQVTSIEYVKESAITANVKALLLADPDIKSLHISVTTENGIVILTGDVVNQTQMDKAVSIAEKVKGVKSVDNKLRMVSPGK